MKKLLFILLPLLFFSCSDFGEISYDIINKTNYDVVVIDDSTKDKDTYSISANSTLTIKHYSCGNFSLQDNEYPIKINNGFSATYIIDLPIYEYEVFNYADKNYKLIIVNSKYNPKSFDISADSNTTIQSYEASPEIEIYHNNIQVYNYIIKDNKIIIL